MIQTHRGKWMKRILTIAFLFLAACTSSPAENFIEGTHYKVLDLPEAENTVWEVYSVFCPFCERFDNSINPVIKKALPKGASFESVYFPQYNAFGSEAANVLAVMKVLGEDRYEKVKSYYFTEIITNNAVSLVGQDHDFFIDKGLEAGGVERKLYEETLKSDEVQKILDEWNSRANAVVAESKGIPAVVVKGKYLIDLKQVKSEDMLVREILYLLKK